MEWFIRAKGQTSPR